MQVWRQRAERIPDGPIREDALSAITRKRGHTDGAALFWILPRRRDVNLLRLLVAYEIIWDFLDCLNERAAGEGTVNGRQLHLALIEALDPAMPMSDYYCHHPWREDGGYLQALVETCRRSCAALPSYGRVRPLVVREAQARTGAGAQPRRRPARLATLRSRPGRGANSRASAAWPGTS